MWTFVFQTVLFIGGLGATLGTHAHEQPGFYKHHGNVSQAAVELGIGRPYLHKRMAVLGIAKKDIYS